MKEMFTISGLCGVEYVCDKNITHTCSGKVNAMCDGKYVTGFIMKQNPKRWVIKLMNDKEVTLRSVQLQDGK